jgi:hypothetical protein
LNLLVQQNMRAQQFFMTKQQVIHALGNLINGVGLGHGNQVINMGDIVGLGPFCRLNDSFQPKMKLVGARDAGSRRAVQREAGGTSHHGRPNLRCPRNGKQTGLHSCEDSAFISNHWLP